MSGKADWRGLGKRQGRVMASYLAIGARRAEQEHTRKYRFALGAGDPGAEIVRETRRGLALRDVLEDLREEIGYTVSVGVLDETRVLYVHRLFGHRRGQHSADGELRVGMHVPIYCTALGKAMLAGLPALERRERVARIDLVPHGPRSITVHEELLAELEEIDPRAPIVSDEELVLGARSIAMLLQRAEGEQKMAIEVTVPSNAYTTAQLCERIGPKLRRAVRLSAR
jgi:DNA-binding IclR family transcriptional regulator